MLSVKFMVIKNKNGDVSQVFVYAFSIIIIGFEGFLVIQFVSTLISDSETRINIDFFSDVEDVYDEVANTWNAERVIEFRVTDNIEYVCFINEGCDSSDLPVDENVVDTLIEGNSDIALFEAGGNIVDEESLGDDFSIENDCHCGTPMNGRIEIGFFNERNEMIIKVMD